MTDPNGPEPRKQALSPWKRSVAVFATVMVTLNVAIAVLAGSLSWRSTARAQTGLDAVQQRVSAASAAREAVLQVDGALMTVVARSDPDSTRAAAVASIAAASKLDECLQALQAVMADSTQVAEMVQLADAIKPHRMAIIRLARQNDDEQALAALEKLAESLDRINALSRRIQEEETQAQQDLLHQLKEEARQLNLWLLIACGSCLAIGALAYRQLMRRLSRSDELERLIGEVQESARTLEVRGHELGELSRHITDSDTTTARVMSEVSSGLHETRSDAGRSLEALQALSQECTRSIAAAREQAQRASQARTDAKTSSDKLSGVAATTKALAESQQAIVEFTERISKISATTRLLSMNAAVEAARAGESGRGFAVVAQSVRSLSQETQDTAIEIRHLSQTVAQQMQQALSAVTASVQAMQSCGQRIDGLEQFAQNTAVTVEGMSEGLNSFSRDLEQQTRRIDRLGSSVDGLASTLDRGRTHSSALMLNAEALGQASSNLRSRLTSVES